MMNGKKDFFDVMFNRFYILRNFCRAGHEIFFLN